MPTLFPPKYPERPDMPLYGFGVSFAEELSRSVIHAIYKFDDERPHELEVRIAGALTMLEAFYPRDHLECMMAAQGVACHAAIMDSFASAMLEGTPDGTVIKFRQNAASLHRMFSNLVKDIERRQSKPLPERPKPPSAPPATDPEPPEPVSPAPPSPPRAKRKRAAAPMPEPVPVPEPAAAVALTEPPPFPNFDDVDADIAMRPDGTPGSLFAYAPKPPVEHTIPGVPPIMLALATRSKPYYQVNVPEGQAPPEPPDPSSGAVVVPMDPAFARGPLNLTEPMFTGDALSRFAATRLVPDAMDDRPVFEDDEAVVHLELISTGGDPEAEEERRRLIAAHPEGKPIATLRFGTRYRPATDPPESISGSPPSDPPEPKPDGKKPPDT